MTEVRESQPDRESRIVEGGAEWRTAGSYPFGDEQGKAKKTPPKSASKSGGHCPERYNIRVFHSFWWRCKPASRSVAPDYYHARRSTTMSHVDEVWQVASPVYTPNARPDCQSPFVASGVEFSQKISGEHGKWRSKDKESAVVDLDSLHLRNPSDFYSPCVTRQCLSRG
jgi:hypothetical protein